MVEICDATRTSRGASGPHEGMADPINVTIMDNKRTVCGICMYCFQPIIAQEPLYNTMLAPVRAHHGRLPVGMWRCPVTRIDHMVAGYVRDGDRVYECIDCHTFLTHYQFRDNLTGLESDIFLNEMIIEEEPY